jgi:hypothetical protein
MSDVQHGPIEDDYEEGGWGRLIAIAVVVAIAIAAVFFFVGKAAGGGSSGPTSLASAITQAQQGKLSCGDVNAAVAAARPNGGQAGNAGAANGGAPNFGGFLARGLCGDNSGSQEQAQGQGQFGRRGFGGGLTGQVTAVTDSSLTITTPAGSRTIKIGPDTQIDKTAKAGKSDLRKGVTVSVAGAGAPGGNAQGTATRIVIVPAQQQQ